MPTESTKRAVQQLRDHGYEAIAEKLRDLVLTVEAVGGSCGVGFVEWRPELAAAQILLRMGELKKEPTHATSSS
jgi:hypothetical protein